MSYQIEFSVNVWADYSHNQDDDNLDRVNKLRDTLKMEFVDIDVYFESTQNAGDDRQYAIRMISDSSETIKNNVDRVKAYARGWISAYIDSRLMLL